MSRNKEKQKNQLNRLYLSKSNPRKFHRHQNPLIFSSIFFFLAKPKRPHIVSSYRILKSPTIPSIQSQVHTVDELRRWLPIIEREIHTTLAVC